VVPKYLALQNFFERQIVYSLQLSIALIKLIFKNP
jgi:hypothetical protein